MSITFRVETKFIRHRRGRCSILDGIKRGLKKIKQRGDIFETLEGEGTYK